MLTSLKIQNFKGWKDTGNIRLAPITVFFGTNSSGKSSINQFLLMLKQTVQSPDRQRVLHFGDENTPIDLGTFHDVITGHDETQSLGFDFEWNLQRKKTISDTHHEHKIFKGDSIKFSAEIGLSADGATGIKVNKLSYELNEKDENSFNIELKLISEQKGKYELISEKYDLVRSIGRSWPLPNPVHFYGFPAEVTAYYQNAHFLPDLTLALENCFNDIYYLGPLREHPHRSYIWDGGKPEHVGWKGEKAVAAILSAKDRMISPGFKRLNKPIAEIIAKWLKQMNQ